MALSKHDEEKLHAMISRATEKFVGNEDPELSQSALSCIVKGYDRRKTES